MRAHRILLTLAAGLFALGLGRDMFDNWVTRTEIPPLILPVSAEVQGRGGVLLRAFTVADGRWRLAPGAVDPLFTDMLVAYEDQRFYSHSGVDPLALARAVGQALWRGRVVSGGSTLTMQVARLLEESGTGRWEGKLRQVRLALALERRLTKAEILDLYLRIAPYGGNLEGVRAAAFAWFGKEPRRLTPAQAALLVALPQAPESRRPDRDRAAAAEARARVLARAAARGLIDADQVRAALTEPVPAVRRDFPAIAPLLAERLHRQKPDAPVIQTTIDASLQAALEQLAVRAGRRAGERLSLAVLVADHRTGEILASVGAADWADDRRGGYIDMIEALRSPGSTLKPFVYGLAFDQGLAHPETMILDRPMAFGGYAPQNFDGQFRGRLTLRKALQDSLNIPAVALTEALGPAKLMRALRQSGAQPVVPGGRAGLAVALGGVGITLKDLVQAYAALARLGLPVRLSEIPGKAGPLPGRMLTPEAAWQVDDILAGLPPPNGAMPGRLAYKTGTSYGHRDALAVGFDGRHVAGVWMGRADGAPVPGAFGGDMAAPVLFEVFGRISPEFAPLPPPPPATLMVSTEGLPPPLRQFRSREAALAARADDAPKVAFPPDGAEVETAGGILVVKVRDGVAPFVWLANGQPVQTATAERESHLPIEGPGFYRLSVIDAKGKSAAVEVIAH